MLDLSSARVVGPGLSGLACVQCAYQYSHFEVSGLTDVLNCPKCDDLIDIASLHLSPIFLGLNLLDDDVARKTRWFHLTHRRYWHETVIEAQVPVHIGSELAAITRAYWVADRARRWWMHELELATNTSFAPGVEEDAKAGDLMLSLSEFEDLYETADAVRYLNVFEDPGNISLAIDPRFVRVVSSTVMSTERLAVHLRQALDERHELEAQLAAL